MKKLLRRETMSGNYSPKKTACCTIDSPCVRCSMIRLTSHRFAIFHKKFGRLPDVNDELFFDEAISHPVRASEDEIRNQIFAAAKANGLNFATLLSHLGLSSATGDETILQ